MSDADKNGSGWGNARKRLAAMADVASERAPSLIEQTKLGSVRAFRRGSELLSTDSLSTSAVDLKSLGFSFLATVAMFFMANIAFSYSVGSAYLNFKPEGLMGVTTLGELNKQLPRVVPGAAGTELDRLADDDIDSAFHLWIQKEFLSSGVDEEASQLEQQLRESICGNASGWILVNRQVTTGSEVYDSLLNTSPATIGLIDEDPGRKQLCIGLLDTLAQGVQEPIRTQMRINGLIQFLTVIVCVFVLTAVGRRYFFVNSLSSRWLAASSLDQYTTTQDGRLSVTVKRLIDSDEDDFQGLVYRELDRLRTDTTEEIYQLYWFIAGLLPSLGFIGTVVGMSASLMLADDLFVTADKQMAISRMTSELGLAFDTTLVSLVLGMIAGVLIAATQSRERTFFQSLAANILKQKSAMGGRPDADN